MQWWPSRDKVGLNSVTRRPGEALGVAQRVGGRFKLLRGIIVPWLSVVFLLLLIVVPIGLFGWFLFATDMFKVKAVTVVDAREETAGEVKQIVEEILTNSPLGKNVFFIQADAIEEVIKERIAKVRTVHVVRKLPATIKVIVQEKEPALLLLSGGKYYFIDETGVAYEVARLDTLPGIVLTTVKNDDEEAEVRIGAMAVDASLINFLKEVSQQIPEVIGAEVGEVHVPSLAAREVRIIIDNNWTLLFGVNRSASGQIGVIKKLLREIVSEQEVAAMQYIDVRIQNRIYYKTALGD